MSLPKTKDARIRLLFGDVCWEIRFAEGLEPLASRFLPLFSGFLTDCRRVDAVLHVACDFRTKVKRPPAVPASMAPGDDRLSAMGPALEHHFGIDPSNTPVIAFKNGCLAYRGMSDEGHFLFYNTRRFNNFSGTFYKLFYLFACLVIAEKGGLVVHGTGFDLDGVGALFVGASGAGKTTVASTAPLERVLSDDGPVVRRDKRGDFLIYASPFRQIHAFSDAESDDTKKKSLLRNIYFLNKSDRFDILPRARVQALAEMVLQHIHAFPLMSPHLKKAVFLFVHEIFSSVGIFDLHFRRDDPVWEAILGRG